MLIALAGWLAWPFSDDPLPTIAWFRADGSQPRLDGRVLRLASPEAALVVIAVLLVAIVIDCVLSWRVSTVAGALFIPYLAWVVFASSLNIGVVALN